MTNRQTKGFCVKNTQPPYMSGMDRIKGHDSYCYSPYNSSFMRGGRHA
ncbi:MAG: hypothetical protein ACK5MN_10535 [Lachnospiraceae bacterium]